LSPFTSANVTIVSCGLRVVTTGDCNVPSPSPSERVFLAGRSHRSARAPRHPPCHRH
jgi:hypothetical protein